MIIALGPALLILGVFLILEIRREEDRLHVEREATRYLAGKLPHQIAQHHDAQAEVPEADGDPSRRHVE